MCKRGKRRANTQVSRDAHPINAYWLLLAGGRADASTGGDKLERLARRRRGAARAAPEHENDQKTDEPLAILARTPAGVAFAFAERRCDRRWLLPLNDALDGVSPWETHASAALSAATAAAVLLSPSKTAAALLAASIWRIAATVGLGAALAAQATSGSLSAALARAGLAPRPLPSVPASSCTQTDPAAARTHAPRTHWAASVVAQAAVRYELATGALLDYDDIPADLAAWILFSQISDIVHFNDAFAFVLVVITQISASHPLWTNPSSIASAFIMLAGIILIALALAFKLSSRKTLSDYDWYWGAFFFFLEDRDDTQSDADASVQAAARRLGLPALPHPLHALGFLGHYGAAFLAQSYMVFLAALASHASQILFLYLVERPHFAKLRETRYAIAFKSSANAPSTTSHSESDHCESDTFEKAVAFTSACTAATQKFFARDLIIFRGFDLFRSTDTLTLLVCLQSLFIALVVGSTDSKTSSISHWFFIGHTLFWRLVHTWGHGLVLLLQDRYKLWTRHFVRHGESLKDAFNHWKVFFNLSLTMTYLSFSTCVWRLYQVPDSFAEEYAALRHIVGAIFVVLHVWITACAYEVHGPAGWFHADFFIGPTPWSAYACGFNGSSRQGIYRYIDHPQLYLFSCFGLALISGSWTVLGLAVFAQASHWLLYTCIIAPHEYRLYGTPDDFAHQNEFMTSSNRTQKPSIKKLIRKSLRRRMRSFHKQVRRVGRRVVATVEKFEFVDSIMRRVRSFSNLVGSTPSLPRLSQTLQDSRHRRGSSVGGVDRDSADLATCDSSNADAQSDDVLQSADGSNVHSDVDGQSVSDLSTSESDSKLSDDDDVSQSTSDSEYDYEAVFLNEIHDPSTVSTAINTVDKDSHDRGASSIDRSAFGTTTASTSASPMSGVLARARTVSQTVRQVIHELEGFVDTAKPRVKAMVDQTRRGVTALADAAHLADALPRSELPLHLYTLSIPNQSNTTTETSSNHDDDVNGSGMPVFQFGEPIVIEFTAVRETMKRKDWVGLYSVDQNFRQDITTSKCDTRWTYVAGHHKQLVPIPAGLSDDNASLNHDQDCVDDESRSKSITTNPVHDDQPVPFSIAEITFYDEKTSPWILTRDGRTQFGRTEVTLSPSPGDPGLRVARGRLVFSREQLPWKTGLFEARYHYDGKYVVLARSTPFKIVMDVDSMHSRHGCKLAPSSIEMHEDRLMARTTHGIASELQPIVERCLDLYAHHGAEGLDLHEPMLDRVTLPPVLLRAVSLHRYRREVCRRIVYVIHYVYGIEFTCRVVEMAQSLMDLAERVHDALEALERI